MASALLGYLDALTFEFEREGKRISGVLVYAEPDKEGRGTYRFVPAADTGYEGIACVDDTARAATLALGVYERSRSRRALRLAHEWLSFVEYMQYPDGSFANFIRNESGVRNSSGPTSQKGGYWWSGRALHALARAYRLTREESYRERYEACQIGATADGKIDALLGLAELEMYARRPSDELHELIVRRCEFLVDTSKGSYFRDQPESDHIHLWGYHQLQFVALAARKLRLPALLKPCRETAQKLAEPAIRARFWYSFPDRSKKGLCAYCVSPFVQGLAEMYRATEAKRYRDLALEAAAWFYGRNDARTPLYDPTTGMCRDGIINGVASKNAGAESSIEAGLAELERRALMPLE